MNPIERKREERRARIIALGSRIRVLGLDRDDIGGPEADASADALMRENPTADVEEGLGFAAYLSGLADPGCPDCAGLGAVRVPHCGCDGKRVEGVYVHAESCVDGLATDRCEPCGCVVRAERRARSERQAEAPAFRSTRGDAADLDRRIAAVEKSLVAAREKMREAVGPLDAEVERFGVEAARFERGRMERQRDLAEFDKEVGRRVSDVDQARRMLAVKERSLALGREEREGREKILREYERAHAPLLEKRAEAEKNRNRVAGHHRPKVEKLERKLRRLVYLRGGGAVSAEELRVTFVGDGEAESGRGS